MRGTRLEAALLLLCVISISCGEGFEVAGGERGSEEVVESSASGVFLSAASSDGPIPKCPAPPEGVIVDPAPDSMLFDFISVWVDVSLAELVKAMEASDPSENIDGAMRLAASLPGGLTSLNATSHVIAQRDPEVYDDWMFYGGTAELLRTRKEARALVGLAKSGLPGTGFINMVVLEDPSGSFTLVAECGFGRIAASVGDYAKDLGRSDSAVFRDIATDNEALFAFDRRGFSEPVPWSDRSPSERQLDIEATPADVLDGLESVFITIDAPPEWHGFNASLCSRIDLGWNYCTRFDADEVGEPLELDGFFDRSGTIEVWIVEAGAKLSAPLAKIGTFTADDFVDATELQLRVAGDWKTLDSVVANSEKSIAILEVVR
jgi:hypothetical protein